MGSFWILKYYRWQISIIFLGSFCILKYYRWQIRQISRMCQSMLTTIHHYITCQDSRTSQTPLNYSWWECCIFASHFLTQTEVPESQLVGALHFRYGKPHLSLLQLHIWILKNIKNAPRLQLVRDISKIVIWGHFWWFRYGEAHWGSSVHLVSWLLHTMHKSQIVGVSS